MNLIRSHSLLAVVALLVVLALIRVIWIGRDGTGPSITVYSGRTADLIQPLIDQFERETGIRVQVRYGQTAEMAATILEEGRRSPADVFLAQDAGALGALARADRLTPLPADLLDLVEARFRSPAGQWVGLSGRARVIAYHPDRIDPSALPDHLQALCEPHWQGRVGWAPMNASFQAFVTALRVTEGHDAARDWLTCMARQRTRSYANNSAILMAVASGEIDAGLVNHYYLHALARERTGALPIRNHYPAGGVLVNVAGAGILRTASAPDLADRFLRYLLDESAQRYFTDRTFEYPLVRGIAPNEVLPPLHDLQTTDLDLNQLDDLERTLRLLQDVHLL